MEIKIFLILITLVFNILFIRAGFKENGGFDKKETGILLIGNLLILSTYGIFNGSEISDDKFSALLWTFVFGIGILKGAEVLGKYLKKNGT